MVGMLRPYIYWIIMVVLIVVVLAFGLSARPKTLIDNDLLTVDKAANKLDARFAQLAEMATKARNEITEIETSQPEAFERILEEHLVTKAWESGLTALKRDYQEQQQAIVKELLASSALLDESINPTTEKDVWYFDYQSRTGSLLWSLHEQGLLALEVAVRRSAPAVVLAESDFLARRDFRRPFGIFTKDTVYPDQSLWPILTLRFRLIEVLADLLPRGRATALPNPLLRGAGDEAVELVPEPQPAQVQLVRLTWATGDVPESGGDVTQLMAHATVPGGEVIRFTLELRGTPSALLAFTAALESSNRPMVALLAAEWRNTTDVQRTAGVFNPPDREMSLTLQVAALRYQRNALEALAAREN